MRWHLVSAILLLASAALAQRDEKSPSAAAWTSTGTGEDVRDGIDEPVPSTIASALRKKAAHDTKPIREVARVKEGRKEPRSASLSRKQRTRGIDADVITQTTSLRTELTGRFLHITDFHPDWHYTTGASFTSGCHRIEDKDKDVESERAENAGANSSSSFGKHKHQGPLTTAGKWGTSNSDCDAPMSLVNLTLSWLGTEWRDEVDFVVWTGDSARHDIDREIPRTMKEIGDSNRWMSRRMREVFGKEVRIVPSLGNNDIYPHNILMPGPNRVTDEFADIWSPFIPDEQYHVFQRGAYYSVEVIPDELAVISLNTIYWYDSNKAVDGCKLGSDEPGALQFDWLEVQLEAFRERGMQVWLSGHVPPHEGLYFDNCYLRYGQLALRFQDTIVGHLYGHMNVDHFFFIDVPELEAVSVSSSFAPGLHPTSELSLTSDRNNVHTMGRTADTKLQGDLSDTFKGMPKIKKLEKKLDDYVVINVGPSVVPTYLPSVRIYGYNISSTGGEGGKGEAQLARSVSAIASLLKSILDGVSGFRLSSHIDLITSMFDFSSDAKKKKRKKKKKRSKKDCSRSENEDKPHCAFKRKPRYVSADSPSRTNRRLSPLGWAQFYLPKMDEQRGKGFEEPPKWEVEYTTYSKRELLRGARNRTGGEEGTADDMWSPVPLRLLPGYEEWEGGAESMTLNASRNAGSSPDEEDDDGNAGDSVEDDKEKSKETFEGALRRITPYKMKDLTIGSYAKFAKRLADDSGLWDKFAASM